MPIYLSSLPLQQTCPHVSPSLDRCLSVSSPCLNVPGGGLRPPTPVTPTPPHPTTASPNQRPVTRRSGFHTSSCFHREGSLKTLVITTLQLYLGLKSRTYKNLLKCKRICVNEATDVNEWWHLLIPSNPQPPFLLFKTFLSI